MFNKLRNKFLILNLVIISIMMIIAFTSIYLITYNDVRRDIDMELFKLSDFNRKQNDRPYDNPNQPKPNFNNLQPSEERLFSFTLTIDNEEKIITFPSFLSMDNDFYETAKNTALSKNTTKGYFKLQDNHWAFMIKPHFDSFRIVFLDITSQQAILTNLIYTFLIVALVMLIFIFFVSRFFANKAIAPIKETFDKQKQFIADASHELKTPLAVINTNVDVLLSNGEDSINTQSKWLYYIKSETERMTKLTKDLLYLTQVDYSEIHMIYSEFNLSETIENVILTMEAVVFENNNTLNYEIENDNLTTYGNSEQIKQAVMILLDNAIKYTNDKGSINITLKRHYNNAIFSITNTGEGIPEDHISKIFDRFYRIDKSRSRDTGGYGLGLAIARTIIEHHKGKISAVSIPNESTTFTFELPLVNK